MRSLFVTLLAVAAAPAALAQHSLVNQDKQIHMNQIQVIGSHNSYHMGFAPGEAKWLEQRNPDAYHSLEYRHAPLADQLDGGVRQLEIDIFADPKGGKFAHPKVVEWVKAAGLPADPDFDPDHEMDKPGFKVMHVQDLDERSQCHTFVKCLQQVKGWSKAHPKALPVFLLIETKEGGVRNLPGAEAPLPFTSETFDAVDAEIRSVFSEDEMITPDMVRGKYATLPEAVKAGNWPTLDKARGKVVFLIDQRPKEETYVAGHPALKGRVMFTNAVPGRDDAAFTEMNSGSKEEIDALVKQGYLVRARTDDGTTAARTNDTKRREEVLASGAQLVSTDYPPSEPASWTGFFVGFPGDLVARCNPIDAPALCDSKALDGTLRARH